MHVLCCEPQTSVWVQEPPLSFSYQDALADTLSQVLLRFRHCASPLPFHDHALEATRHEVLAN